jgi:Lon protease-like protein
MIELDSGVLALALDALPIFPLPDVVLFPRALLPLHVFEPRYQALLADCLATHKCMAMALTVGVGGDSGDPERPGVARIAGAGIVVQHQALGDGRSNIMLHGRARVLLEELPFEPPYRRARARVLQEVGSAPDAQRAALRAAAVAFVSAARRRDVEIELELPADIDAAGAADLCAHHLVLDPAVRQRALEELDVGARVLLVTAELAGQAARLGGDSGASN